MTAHTPTPLIVLGVNGVRFGTVCWQHWTTSDESGWQFIPATPTHKPSRKLWGVPHKAIPDWVGPYRMVPTNRDSERINKLEDSNERVSEFSRQQAEEVRRLVADLERCKAALRECADDMKNQGYIPPSLSRASRLLADLDKEAS